ncbi:MAG: hypothetical protein ACK2UK_11225 [Candidatus Promineifilaceae bacterium]
MLPEQDEKSRPGTAEASNEPQAEGMAAAATGGSGGLKAGAVVLVLVTAAALALFLLRPAPAEPVIAATPSAAPTSTGLNEAGTGFSDLTQAAMEMVVAFNQSGGGAAADGPFIEVPPTLWAAEIMALDPLRVYWHLNNLAVVLSEDETIEEGLYIGVPISSYMPQENELVQFAAQADGSLRFTKVKQPGEQAVAPIISEDLSPDGRWRAIVRTSDTVLPQEGDETFPNGRYFVELVVDQVDGPQSWTAVSEWRGAGLGQTYPQPVRWSADGRYLYYANVAQPDGCSMLANGGDLWRLDLQSGEVSEIAPYIGLVMALSSDEARLAVNASYGRGFLLRDLATGVEQPVPLPEAAQGWAIADIQWSPDGRAVLLVMATNPCTLETGTAVVLVNAAEQTAEILVEPQDRRYSIAEWLSDTGALLEDDAGTIWRLDLAGGELSAR